MSLQNLKFRKRNATKQVCIVCKDTKGLSKDRLFQLAWREGELGTGYHLILQKNGVIEPERDIEAVAQFGFPEYETSIYVLADAKDMNSLSDSQKMSVKDIKERYKLPIKYVEV